MLELRVIQCARYAATANHRMAALEMRDVRFSIRAGRKGVESMFFDWLVLNIIRVSGYS